MKETRIKRFNENSELNISDVSDSKLYTKDDLINLLYDYEVTRLGKWDPYGGAERNFTNPNSPGYISLDRIKSKIVDFLKDK